MAIFSRLAAVSFGIQTVAGLIFIPLQEDRFFDFCGSLGFIITNLASSYAQAGTPLSHFTTNSWVGLGRRRSLLNVVLYTWAVRLGAFLFSRALKHGGDSRFEKIRKNPKAFTVSWLGQAVWVLSVGLPVYLVNSVPAGLDIALTPIDYASLAFLAGSWLFELVADYQKTVWRHSKDKKLHNEKFISHGLWAISRHPNYVGEVGIWTGVWALSIPALKANAPLLGNYIWLIAGVSPVMTYLLTRYVSGVPPLEESGAKKFGDDPKWKEYTRTVPIFFPWVRPS
ncbi:hypothetical protein QCA50_005727 [Cerrena zonata]|uniref:Steroid 5-alpha reductase C-terminal domain-containing protein n=1 Tax=Cerrena zonata TaxID=2478898 RepID=A0AAW0GB21_9APHY